MYNIFASKSEWNITHSSRCNWYLTISTRKSAVTEDLFWATCLVCTTSISYYWLPGTFRRDLSDLHDNVSLLARVVYTYIRCTQIWIKTLYISKTSLYSVIIITERKITIELNYLTSRKSFANTGITYWFLPAIAWIQLYRKLLSETKRINLDYACKWTAKEREK